MGFGLAGAPWTLCRIMNDIFKDVKDFVSVYLDDIQIHSKTFVEHVHHVQVVLQKLLRAGLKLKPSKCSFAKQEVNFLVHQISRSGIAIDPKKITAIKNMPRPVNTKGVKSLLGIVSYIRRFLPNVASVTVPLICLTKKGVQFAWDDPQEKAWQQILALLTTAPVLSHFDPTLPVEIETDASGDGVAAILKQRTSENKENRCVCQLSTQQV